MAAVMFHIPDEDVTDARTPTAEQARAIDLLELNPGGRPTVRLTWAQWRWVNRVVVTLGALGVPPVREGAGNGLYGRVSDSEGLGCVPTPRDGTEANEGDDE